MILWANTCWCLIITEDQWRQNGLWPSSWPELAHWGQLSQHSRTDCFEPLKKLKSLLHISSQNFNTWDLGFLIFLEIVSIIFSCTFFKGMRTFFQGFTIYLTEISGIPVYTWQGWGQQSLQPPRSASCIPWSYPAAGQSDPTKNKIVVYIYVTWIKVIWLSCPPFFANLTIFLQTDGHTVCWGLVFRVWPKIFIKGRLRN